jgi:UDP-N-acetylmuramoyl-L-alanyl-D-glutamate--2,6-diaminopimelate ligase
MSDKSVSLQKILAEFPFRYEAPDVSGVTITGITLDSRAVEPGYLFVAQRGAMVDGHDFIPSAVSNGAAAVAGDRPLMGLKVPYVRLHDARVALTWLSAAFYDWPGRKLTVVGVTGTDGKTTTANLIYQILRAAGVKAGMVSTVNAVLGDEVLDTGFHVTTPDAHDLQRYLARMVDAGLTHAVLETTSHGWAQHRVDACEFDVGAVTNITHEHLDQHGSYQNYLTAKARLFSSLERTRPKPQGNPRLAVLNRDDSSFDFLNGVVKVNRLTYGLHPNADLRAVDAHYGPNGTRFTVIHPAFRVGIRTGLVGEYNIYNCLAALGVSVLGLSIPPETAASGIGALGSVPGRMERIDLGQPFTAIVDFAHTPNALKVTLQAARRIQTDSGEPARSPRLIAVFGSAGLRDREKRRMMAETSAQLADFTVLTAEDPRTESLDAILAEMAVGATRAGGREGETFRRVPDRGEAIRFALKLAQQGDIVLACGKGHEQSMCFGRIEHPWDDRTAMRAALSELLGVEGPAMPYLPTQDKPEAEWLRS